MLLFSEAYFLAFSSFNLVIVMVWYGKYQFDLYGKKWHEKLWVDFLMFAVIYVSLWKLLLSHLSNIAAKLHITIHFGGQHAM